MKIKIHCHAGNLITISQKGDELLLDIYDSTYPLKAYRGRANLIGGVQKKSDRSPKEILEREINEEFSNKGENYNIMDSIMKEVVGEGPGAPRPERFAPESDIIRIRGELINFKPYKDYLVKMPLIEGKENKDFIVSVYSVTISQNIFELAKYNLLHGNSIKNEGLSKIINMHSLIKGETLTARAAGIFIGDYFNVKLPNPEEVKASPIGVPRRYLKNYSNEFYYASHFI